MELLLYPILLAAFTIIFTIEVIAPASKSSCNKRWLIIAGIMNIMQLISSLAVGHFFKLIFFSYSLLSLPKNMPDYLVGAIAFFITSFIFYWWHRAVHHVPFLWRSLHQLHHSPSRIESLSAFYVHPLDTFCANLITCFGAYLIIGASPMAVAWCLLYGGLFNLYIHSDTSSPQWLGYFLQRPEMHRLHHKHKHHAQNYGIPLWDILFGTWENPKTRPDRCGFDTGLENKIFDMLIGRDVHTHQKEVSKK
jgi:sterol desaturase/sphingolipid hydroxylase (fatty acid hydroxylase superfamily)